MKVVEVQTDHGYRTGILITEGRKYASIIWPDASGIRVNRIPWIEQGKHRQIKLTLREVELKGKPYPIARAKKSLRAMGRRVGITKQARRALRA